MNNQERKNLKNKILKRHKLFELGKSKIARLLKDPFRTFVFYLIAIIARIKPFRVTAKTLWGDKMSYYLPEGQAIFYYGFFEANLSNFFINFIKEGDVFFDVGAHVGFYSALASSLVGSSGEVHSFEPTPRTFESLRRNTCKKNNVKINNFAVYNNSMGISFFDFGPKFSAFNSFKNREDKSIKYITKNKKEIKVKTIVLDEYCLEGNLKPSLIKIDAEGAEYLILDGMSMILKNIRPVITIEVAGEDEWRYNCSKSIEILLSNYYSIFEIDLFGNLKNHKVKDSYLYDNLVFIPTEKLSDFKSLILN